MLVNNIDVLERLSLPNESLADFAVFIQKGFISGAWARVVGFTEKLEMIMPGSFVPAGHAERFVYEVIRVFIVIGHQRKVEETDARVIVVCACHLVVAYFAECREERWVRPKCHCFKTFVGSALWTIYRMSFVKPLGILQQALDYCGLVCLAMIAEECR